MDGKKLRAMVVCVESNISSAFGDELHIPVTSAAATRAVP